ncbi:MAG: UDP-N-acetylmuramate--L-alanine ligase [Oceanococcus sp.]
MIDADGLKQMLVTRMGKVRAIHFVGIGGSGMAGIAEVLINLGYQVSGTDLGDTDVTRRLVALGARVIQGHSAQAIVGADVVVRSTAIANDNPEIVAAQAARIPVIRRAEMLAELMRFRIGIAIAGTHGKTTTTSLTAAVLAAGGLDPTYVVGGLVKSSGSNARLGAGPYLVAEADESDASFLHLTPMIAAVTNIDHDHMETYGGDFSRLCDAFVEFLHFLPFYGLAVLCADDLNLQRLIPQVGRPVVSYGIDSAADIRAVDLKTDSGGTRFKVVGASDQDFSIRLNLPGPHNVLNALAAIAIARELDVSPEAIQSSLDQFAGIGRRAEQLGDLPLKQGSVYVVDDYGHHPREVACTLQAMRHAWPERRLVVAFQPHRYSRTRDLLDDFAEVLGEADVLLLTEVYAAGEAPLPGADGRSLARAVRLRGDVEPIFVAELSELSNRLASVLNDGDLLLTLGAGNIGHFAQGLIRDGLPGVDA